MKERLYVIATRGRNNKEIYLAIDEAKSNFEYYDTIKFKWTENIEEAIATFNYADIEKTATSHFKNYTKWYITDYEANFE